MFSKDNDIIKRIMNLILVVWIIVAIVISYNSVVDLLFDNPKYNYEEYKIKYCNEELDKYTTCEKKYETHLSSQKREKRTKTKVLINSTGNVMIIGFFTFLLNRKK
jgi:hypothetical protein